MKLTGYQKNSSIINIIDDTLNSFGKNRGLEHNSYCGSGDFLFYGQKLGRPKGSKDKKA